MAVLIQPRTPAAVIRTGRWLFALALSVYLCTAGGSLTSTDAVVAFDVTQRIVEERSVALSGNLLGMDAHRGADGRYYSPFGLAQSIYNIPFYLAGKAATSVMPVRIGKPDSLLKATVALGQTLLVAVLVWQIFTIAMLVASPRAALTAALTCAFASLLWPYSSFGFNQPLAAVTLLAAVGSAIRGVRLRNDWLLIGSGLWLGVSLFSRHEMALGAIPIALWLLLDGNARWPARMRRVVAFAPGVIAATAAWLLYNDIRFGNPLDSGHLRDPIPGFGSPIASGLAGLLFSPSTSILLYSPFAALGALGLIVLLRRDRSIAALSIAICVGMLLFYATLGNWMAGRSYGSRYLLVVLPYLGIGWAVLLDRLKGSLRVWLAAVVMTVGVIVQVPGVLVDYAKVSQAAAARDGAATTETRQWSWGHAPMVLNTHALMTALPDNVAYVTGARPAPATEAARADDDRSFSQQFAFSLDLWWLYLYYLGALPRAGVAGVLIVFVLAIGWCAWRLRYWMERLPRNSKATIEAA